MKIYFSTRKLQKVCSSSAKMQAEFGVKMARKLQQRLMELKAADCLDDLSRLPPARCHELTGDLRGKLSVDLAHPYRLFLVPAHDPVPTRPDGGLDWQQVTEIEVVAVGDPH